VLNGSGQLSQREWRAATDTPQAGSTHSYRATAISAGRFLIFIRGFMPKVSA
jgi:hypothetical protein